MSDLTPEADAQTEAWRASIGAPVILPPAKQFAQLLEHACEEFEILQRLLRGQLKLSATEKLIEVLRGPIVTSRHIDREQQKIERRSTNRIEKVLALAFLFDVNRAYRLCEHFAGLLDLPREERRRFLRALRPVVAVRDVNEHSSDPRAKDAQPAMHIHEFDNVHVAVNERAMTVIGADRIFMGPINLVSVYDEVDHMRRLAGRDALRKRPANAKEENAKGDK